MTRPNTSLLPINITTRIQGHVVTMCTSKTLGKNGDTDCILNCFTSECLILTSLTKRFSNLGPKTLPAIRMKSAIRLGPISSRSSDQTTTREPKHQNPRRTGHAVLVKLHSKTVIRRDKVGRHLRETVWVTAVSRPDKVVQRRDRVFERWGSGLSPRVIIVKQRARPQAVLFEQRVNGLDRRVKAVM